MAAIHEAAAAGKRYSAQSSEAFGEPYARKSAAGAIPATGADPLKIFLLSPSIVEVIR